MAAAHCGRYFLKKNWIINNILGQSFAIQGIELISFGSFKIASLLLVGVDYVDNDLRNF